MMHGQQNVKFCISECSQMHAASAINCSKYLHETSQSCFEKFEWFQYVSY